MTETLLEKLDRLYVEQGQSNEGRIRWLWALDESWPQLRAVVEAARECARNGTYAGGWETIGAALMGDLRAALAPFEEPAP